MDGLTESSARHQGTNARKEDGRDRIINLCLGLNHSSRMPWASSGRRSEKPLSDDNVSARSQHPHGEASWEDLTRAIERRRGCSSEPKEEAVGSLLRSAL